MGTHHGFSSLHSSRGTTTGHHHQGTVRALHHRAPGGYGPKQLKHPLTPNIHSIISSRHEIGLSRPVSPRLVCVTLTLLSFYVLLLTFSLCPPRSISPHLLPLPEQCLTQQALPPSLHLSLSLLSLSLSPSLLMPSSLSHHEYLCNSMTTMFCVLFHPSLCPIRCLPLHHPCTLSLSPALSPSLSISLSLCLAHATYISPFPSVSISLLPMSPIHHFSPQCVPPPSLSLPPPSSPCGSGFFCVCPSQSPPV